MVMSNQIGHINLVNYVAYLITYWPTYLTYTHLCPTYVLYLASSTYVPTYIFTYSPT